MASCKQVINYFRTASFTLYDDINATNLLLQNALQKPKMAPVIEPRLSSIISNYQENLGI